MKAKKIYNPGKLLLMAVVVTLGLIGPGKLFAQVPGNGSLINESKVPPSTDETSNLIFIPNCFTPNGDGKNDEFRIFSEQIKSLSLRVFDNKGEEVFATIQVNEGWDGRHYNREMKQDVYLYRLEVSYLNGEDEVIIGQLNLMR